jgi:acetyl esterase/lipase
MHQILDEVSEREGASPSRTVMMGSSMGATAAARFALQRQAAGAILVSPHLDLDLSAIHQGRERHVAAILGAEDVADPRHYPITRELRDLAATAAPYPRIAIQSMRDDDGVHNEQVVPFVEQWRSRGGTVDLDERPSGGHTSEYATFDWFRARIEWCLDSERPV